MSAAGGGRSAPELQRRTHLGQGELYYPPRGNYFRLSWCFTYTTLNTRVQILKIHTKYGEKREQQSVFCFAFEARKIIIQSSVTQVIALKVTAALLLR